MIGRAGLQAAAGYQSSSQLALAGGRDWLNTLDRAEAAAAELIGPGRFRVTASGDEVEVQGDHWLIVAGALVIRSPQGNDLRAWAAGCWEGVELIG